MTDKRSVPFLPLTLPLALTLSLALFTGACAPVTSYTAAEAPKQLKLDTVSNQLDVRFVPGRAVLSAADASVLRGLAASGRIGPADRVTVAVAGSPFLADRRVSAISQLLLPYGVLVSAQPIPDLLPNRGVVVVHRTLVTVPPCPNWSKPSGHDFDNQPSSNFGCATVSNLGMMVANPSDLASGLPGGPTEGQPAAAAVNRYLNDKVVLPTANTALPVAVANTESPQGSATPSTGSP